MLTVPIVTTPLLAVISCSSSDPDYKQMSWSFDTDKIKSLASNFSSFNSQPVSLDKLKQIIKGDGSYIDPYTKEAFDDGWFDSIEFLTDKSGTKATKIVVKLLSKKDDKKCIYRLPNGKLEWSTGF